VNRNNLNNIKSIFEAETGIQLRKATPKPVPTLIITVLMICMMTVSAFAFDLFNTLNGDDLSLSSKYIGNGIVEIYVENLSSKPLEFQPQFKLKLWSTGEDVPRISDNYSMSGTYIEANSNGIVTLDLSAAYDIALLEETLTDDHYYFCLTNNNYVFGQDWICSVNFSDPIITKTYIEYSSNPDPELLSQVEESLRFYYEDFPAWPSDESRALYKEYVNAYTRLFKELEITPVSSIKPLHGSTFVGDDSSAQIKTAGFTMPNLPEQAGYSESMFDVDNKLLSGDMEKAMVIEAYLPHGNSSDSFVSVPVLYVFIYEKDECVPNNYIFVHGQLVRFSDVEECLVYDDGEYCAYDLSHLVYSDFEMYFEKTAKNSSCIPKDFEQADKVRIAVKENFSEYLERHETP